jgi:hypothetical protein
MGRLENWRMLRNVKAEFAGHISRDASFRIYL